MSVTARLTRLELGTSPGPAYEPGWLIEWTTGGDSATFLAVVDAVKTRIPVPARRYVPERRVWWIRAGWLTTITDLFTNYASMRAAADAPDDEDLDDDEDRGRASAGRARYDSPAVPARVGEAFTRLHLLPDAPPELVGAARRILARTAHPDAGGAHTIMVAINQAADTAQAWAERHAASKGGVG